MIKFRSSEEHEELLRKVKKMKKFVDEIEECLEDSVEDDYGFRKSYRKDYDDEEFESRYSRMNKRGGRM